MSDRMIPSSLKVSHVREKTKAALRERLIAQEANEDRKQLLWYLFQESIDKGDNDFRISTKQINEEVFNSHPLDDPTIRSHINRLNRDLNAYFDGAGAKEKYRALIAVDGSRMLHYFVNEEPSRPADLVEPFWEPYLDSEISVLILYPEPQFYRNKSNVYLRHTAVNNVEAAKKRFGPGPLMQSFSFVPSGIVAAILMVLLCFRKSARMYRTPLEAVRVRPSDRPLDLYKHNNLIVLATPTSHGTPDVDPLVFELERGWPLRHDENVSDVTREDDVKHPDDCQEIVDDEKEELEKWVVLTRRQQSDRLVTLVAGWHGRSIEAVAHIITGQTDHDGSSAWTNLREVAAALKCGETFPPEFQVLFKVTMDKRKGDPSITGVHVQRAIPNPRHHKKSIGAALKQSG